MLFGTLFSSLVLSAATLVSAQTDLSSFVEVANLPYRFQLAALNTTLPNANNTGAPLTLGAGGESNKRRSALTGANDVRCPFK
jgi:hypothetical protein